MTWRAARRRGRAFGVRGLTEPVLDLTKRLDPFVWDEQLAQERTLERACALRLLVRDVPGWPYAPYFRVLMSGWSEFDVAATRDTRWHP
jgi:hypothetical protein